MTPVREVPTTGVTRFSVMEGLRATFERHHRLGYGLSGRECLACGAPLFTEELLHHPPAGPLGTVDALRWAGSSYNREAD